MSLYTLALAGSPVQWAIAGIILVMVAAPALLPPLARMIARLLSMEARRRLGMPADKPARRRPDRQQPEVEVLPPQRPVPMLRANQPPLVPTQPKAAHFPIWPAVALACAAVAVLSWYLLHGR